jgi:hypothetical protein
VLRRRHSSLQSRCLLPCTDLTLSPVEIIRLYGLRFNIEHSFKQAVRVAGTLSYLNSFANFIRDRQNPDKTQLFRLCCILHE